MSDQVGLRGEGDARPMPEGFTDRTAWDAIHWRFAGNGSLLDQAVMGWQRANQDRCEAAQIARSRAVTSG